MQTPPRPDPTTALAANPLGTAPPAAVLLGPARLDPKRCLAPALSVPLLALWVQLAPPAAASPMTCTRDVSGAEVIVTCSGDQSAGIGDFDVLQSLPPGAAPPAPAFPTNLDTITVNVRDLDRDIIGPEASSGAATLSFRLERAFAFPAPPPQPTPPPPNLQLPTEFFLNIDLGEHRIDAANTAINLFTSTIGPQGSTARLSTTVTGTVTTRGVGAAALRATAPLGANRLLLTVRDGGVVEGETAVVFNGGSDDPENPNRITVEAGGRLTGALALGAGVDFLENRGVLALRGSSQFGTGMDPTIEGDRFLQAGRLELGAPGQIEAVQISGLERVDFEPGSVLVLDVDGLTGQVDSLQFGEEPFRDFGPIVTLNNAQVEIREQPGRGNFRTGERRAVVFAAEGGFLGGDVVTLRSPETSPNRVIRRSYQLALESNGVPFDDVIEPTDFVEMTPLGRRVFRFFPDLFGRSTDPLGLFGFGSSSFILLYDVLPNQLVLIQTTEGSFLAPGGGNAAAVGAELDRLVNAVAPQDLPEPFETLLAGLGDLERGDPYRDALNQLHAEPYDALLQGSWHAERALVDALWEGCAPGPSGHCAFGAVFGRFLNRAGNPLQADFEETAVGPRGGVSRQLGELAGRSLELRIGAAYEHLDLEWRDGARGRGDRVLGGIALHSRSTGGASSGISLDRLDAGLALVGGGGWFETERALNAIGLTEAEAEPEITFLGGHGRVLHRFGAAPRALGWYAELGLEGSAVALWLDAFTEEADTAGALRLRVAETRELYTSVRPQLALGGSWQWGELRLAPRAQLGLNYAVGGADTPYRARFAGAPAGGGFTTRGDSEDLLIEATGALDLSWGERLSLQLGYAGRVSPDGTTRSHEAQLRAELRF